MPDRYAAGRDAPASPLATPQAGEQGHRTCYADTHLRGTGNWAVCGQVSNIVAVKDRDAVSCALCLGADQ